MQRKTALALSLVVSSLFAFGAFADAPPAVKASSPTVSAPIKPPSRPDSAKPPVAPPAPKVVVAPSGPPWTPPAGQTELALSVVKKADLPDGGFVLTFTLQNKGPKGARVRMASHNPVHLLLTDASKKTVELTPSVSDKTRQIKDSKYDTAPGKSVSFDVSVAKADYVWPKAGDYTLQAYYESHMKMLDGVAYWQGRLDTNTIPVTVK